MEIEKKGMGKQNCLEMLARVAAGSWVNAGFVSGVTGKMGLRASLFFRK